MMNILYVEDEPSDAQLMALYIRTTPHRLVVAEDVQTARKAFADKPDLILVDIMIGHFPHGYNLIKEFRANHCTCPIIAVTALATAQDVKDCAAVGCDYIFHKPFGIERLAELIGKYAA